MEDSRENNSDFKDDSNSSNNSISIEEESEDEAPSVMLTPMSKQSEDGLDDSRPKNYTDDDLEVQLDFSMFSETDRDNTEDEDWKYKRKNKVKGLTLNNSVANIRTPYNSEYLTSTWEEKVRSKHTISKQTKHRPKSS